MLISQNETPQSLEKKITTALNEVYSDRESLANTRLLLEAFLNISLTSLVINNSVSLSQREITKIEDSIQRLLKLEPIQHIIGYTEFYGLKILVNNDVLIPRPETEELVELILSNTNTNSNLNILDIGTGSGCIALSLASNLPNSKVTGIDISEEALTLANKNMQDLDISHVSFLKDNALNFEQTYPVFDIIVSNPPYIKHSETHTIGNNVLNKDPDLALFVPEKDPLIFYNSIVSFAVKNLKKGGQLFFEINEIYGNRYQSLLNTHFKDIEVHKDLQNKDRMVSATKK